MKVNAQGLYRREGFRFVRRGGGRRRHSKPVRFAATNDAAAANAARARCREQRVYVVACHEDTLIPDGINSCISERLLVCLLAFFLFSQRVLD